MADVVHSRPAPENGVMFQRFTMIFDRIIKKIAEQKVKRILDKAVAGIKKGKKITDDDLTSLENEKNGIINLTNTGFEILSLKKTLYVGWESIDKIVSFKRDLWTTDQICLGFIENNNESVVEAHEEMKGFLNLRREIESKYPVVAKRFNEWLLNTPAFDSNPFTLWDRTKT